ncbi:hypothetical protein NMY22_g7879 [Coprinellus aureogranulatus]|nr:hypothetical protein NMY22_g7879 [Coprinellus aureogranulatus]
MSADPSALLHRLVVSAERAKASTYLDVASLVLLVVDYLATLETEARYMWPAPLSLAKFLYFCSRYMVFFDVPFAVYYHTALHVEPKSCRDMFRVGTTSGVIGIVFSEAILFLRVYALSGRDRRLMVYLALQFIATHVAYFAMYGVFLAGVEFGPSPIPAVLGCVPGLPDSEKYDSLLAGMFGLIMANELAIALITSALCVVKYRGLQRSRLVDMFFRDGLVYFAVLTAFSTANIIIDLAGPPEFRFQRVTHSILSCRLILHMRSYATAGNNAAELTSNVDEYRSTPRMVFAQNPNVPSKRRHALGQESRNWNDRDASSRTVLPEESIELPLWRGSKSGQGG